MGDEQKMNYVALFRGINVGGKNIVKMADLRELLVSLGFCEVATYIQSGNAVFEATDEKAAIAEKIRNGFAARFGFASAVEVRNRDEVKAIIEALPFTPLELSQAEAANPQVEHLYVYFLSAPPDEEQLRKIGREYSGVDQLRAGTREVYLLCHQSIRDSKLAAFLPAMAGHATARNWKTVNKLYKMMESV